MGLEFLQAAFLGGLAFAAIPVVIHLMHRRKSRTIPFPTIRFLREVDVRTARRSRLREKLILAIRAAAMALLALALARPVLREGGILGRGRASRAIVLDNSLSMDARREGSSALERSRLAALELVQSLEPADRGAVIPLHSSSGSSAPALTENRRSLEEAVLAVSPTFLGTPLIEAVSKAYRLLEDDANPVREVLVFSDLQASAFPEGAAVPAPRGDIRTIILVPRRPAAANLAVPGLAALPGGGRKYALRAAVRNFGGSEKQSGLSLRIDGKSVEERTVRVPAGAEVPVSLGPVELSPGLREGLLVLGEDPVLADNSHAFSIDVPEAIRVLVARDPGPRGGHDDPAFYLAQALRTAVSQGTLQAKLIDAADLAAEDLSAFDVAVLAEPARIGAQAARALGEFLRRGGGLLFAAGPDLDPEAFRGLSPEGVPGAAADPILPARLEEIVAARQEPFRLERWAERHAIWEPLLSASPPLQPGVPRFLAYWKVLPAQGATVLASFSSGDPALVEAPFGRGRSLLFASTLRPEWNNLPLKFSFVPLVHSALRHLGRSGREPLRQAAGMPLVLRYPEDPAPGEVVLRPPEGAPVAKRPESREGGAASADFGPLERPGLYILEEKFDGRSSRRGLAVNPDLIESALEPLSAERIAAVFPGARTVEFDSSRDAARSALALARGSELKNPLLFILLALILFEPVLANAVAFRRAKSQEAEEERARREAARGGPSP